MYDGMIVLSVENRVKAMKIRYFPIIDMQN